MLPEFTGFDTTKQTVLMMKATPNTYFSKPDIIFEINLADTEEFVVAAGW